MTSHDDDLREKLLALLKRYDFQQKQLDDRLSHLKTELALLDERREAAEKLLKLEFGEDRSPSADPNVTGPAGGREVRGPGRGRWSRTSAGLSWERTS